jgi:hypothetical protein
VNIDLPDELVDCLNQLGTAKYRFGDLVGATSDFSEALALSKKYGLLRGEAQASLHLATLSCCWNSMELLR